MNLYALRTPRGFTLVDFLVVLALVGLLTTIALVGAHRYLMRAKASEAKTERAALVVPSSRDPPKEVHCGGCILADGALE